jgi:hypothetical protein
VRLSNLSHNNPREIPGTCGKYLPQLRSSCKEQKTHYVLAVTMDSYSLGDLVEITGAKRRSIQLWADAGVIQAERATERAGTGVHRRFSRTEAIVACVIHPFAERQIAIGELLSISALIRSSVQMNPDPYDAAILGEGETIFAYERHKKRKGARWPADAPEWISQFTIGPREVFVTRTKSWPDMVMAIRLETYLAGLR